MKKPSAHYTQTIQSEYVLFEEIEDNTHLIDCEIDCQFGRKQIQEVKFENCRFSTADYKQTEFLDVIFQKCDLSNFNFNKSIFYRCEFQTCKLLGTQFIGSTCKDVSWLNCLMNYAILSEGKMNQAYFRESQLEEAFFHNCKFQQTSFELCNLQLADFSESKLKGVDLSSSDFVDIKLTPSLAKGLSIRFDQAPAIAAMLGVTIKN